MPSLRLWVGFVDPRADPTPEPRQDSGPEDAAAFCLASRAAFCSNDMGLAGALLPAAQPAQ